MSPSRPSPAPLDPRLLRAVTDLIHSPALPTLTLTDLADHVGYSPHHFSRIFHATVGLSPGQFLAGMRIDAAKRLLLGGTDAVIDIATAVGFDSPSSFTRRFRTTVGTTPGALRTLADDLAETTLAPVAVGDPRQPPVHVTLDLPPPCGPPRRWPCGSGGSPRPVPFGLPGSGRMILGVSDLVLPLHPGHPWLLGLVVPRHASPEELLTPEVPVFALHPLPVTGPGALTLHFRLAATHTPPMLSALPARVP